MTPVGVQSQLDIPKVGAFPLVMFITGLLEGRKRLIVRGIVPKWSTDAGVTWTAATSQRSDGKYPFWFSNN